ncbi:MAG: XkdX family protein, partial [Faecalibacterium sp.]
TVKQRWQTGRISEAMLRVYVRKGILTAEDFEEITGKLYA